MFEIWEVVKVNDYEIMPLFLIKKTDDIFLVKQIKSKNPNFIVTNKKGEIIIL